MGSAKGAEGLLELTADGPIGEPANVGRGRKYLLTGGGTGGHVTPNIAILTEIRAQEPDARYLYVGSRHGYETRVVEAGIPFRSVSCAPFVSPRQPIRFLRMLLRIFLGVCGAFWVLARFRPDVVVASGGYVSVPTVIAAWLLRRRIYVHESNVHPGLANRLLAVLATRVGASFRESLDQLPAGKSFHAGYPVRRQICEGSSDRARVRFQIPADRRVAFIVGGSMGARSINRGTVEALKTLLKNDNIAVIHSTGLSATGDYEAYRDTKARLEKCGISDVIPGRYICQPFFQDIQDVYALADLVVARAGAGTVMELATVGKASLLIPKSDVPGDHQLLNAVALQRAGSAEVLFEEKASDGGRLITRVRGDALARKISDLLDQPEELRAMGAKARHIARPDALLANVESVRKLAHADVLPETVHEKVRVGFLSAPGGSKQELLFHRNVIGAGLFADIKLRRSDGKARAIIVRARSEHGVEYELIPRRGLVSVNGTAASGRTRLAPADRLDFGGEALQFEFEEREVERVVDRGGSGIKVMVTTIGTFVSRVFGFLRESVAAAVFGLGNITDITAVGISIANFFRGVFAEVAVDTAFLPTYLQLHRTGRRDAANRLFSAVVTWALVLTVAVTVVAVFTMPAWMPHLAGGFAERGILPDAILVTRIMFPYLILVSLAAIISAVLKACNRFAVPAFSSIPFTLGILAGTLGYSQYGLPALGVGVLIGGLGQVLCQLPTLFSREVWRGYGLALRPTFGFREPAVGKVGRVAPNIVLDVSIQKTSSVVDKALASGVGAGAAASLYWGMQIFQLPFALISQSINTVILKELSESQATKEKEWTRRLLASGINWTMFTLLPLTVAMVVLAEPIVRLLFGYGKFGEADVQRVATTLRWYSVGLVGWGLTGLFGRFFSARMEQMKATWTSVIGLVVNITTAVLLVRAGLGEAGIALGTSACFLLTAGLRFALLNSSLRLEGIAVRPTDIVPSLTQTCLATAGATLAAVVVYPAVRDFRAFPEFLNRLFVLMVPMGFGAFAFAATALLVRSEQVEELLLRLGRKRGGREGGGSEPTPVNPYCMEPPARLLSWVQNKANRGVRDQFNLARRATLFLESKDWRTRNIGIKLIGELKLRAFRYDLCSIVRDRTPAPRFERMIGGDFHQPGFVRRNAIAALVALEELDEDIERALMMALQDPYYEVRTEACKALGGWSRELTGAGREEATVRLSRLALERNFEVACEATAALGKIAPDETVVATFKQLHYHRNWQVRERLVQAYGDLYSRGILPDSTRVLALLDDVLTTSEGFTPRFVLKERLSELQNRLLERTEPKPEPRVVAPIPTPAPENTAEAAA